MEWIRLENEIPPLKESVLILIGNDNCDIAQLYNHRGELEWYIDGNWFPFDVGVTHWMPLPKPPCSNDDKKKV